MSLTKSTQTDYTISSARYAKNMMAVRCPSQDGFKTRAARLAESLARGRYTHREQAYLMSKRNAVKFERLYGEGFDASVITRELRPPTFGDQTNYDTPQVYETGSDGSL